MADQTHLVYFIGGPEDQVKRPFPGERPARDWLVTASIETPLSAYAPADVAFQETVRHEYRLVPVPNLTTSGRQRIFAATYVGRLR